jgi:predicted NAD-dependent protein-ADP-ribosyltransferase YbiA (DUF1768 family)
MEARVIRIWKGDSWFLDNSYETPIIFQGISYPSVTHAFLAAQADNIDLKLRISHAHLGELESLANEVGEPFTTFQGPSTMRELLEQKFGYVNRYREMTIYQSRLAKQLVATGKTTLIYGNSTCNTFWGDCNCSKHFDERGKNVLGGLLMGVREHLIELATQGVDKDQTCTCENKAEAFYLYSLNGKLWLKPFCSDCMARVAVYTSKTSDDRGCFRFEKMWFKEKKEPVNKIHVSRHPMSYMGPGNLRPDVFRNGSPYDNDPQWERTTWGGWRRKMDEQVPEQNLPQNKVFYLSGRSIN